MVMGRPSTFTQEQADLICERLACGESLVQICGDPDTPSQTTVYKWLRDYPDFAYMYARAREAQVEPHLEAMFAIADDPNIDPNDKRVRIDVRKWAMSKLAPRKYGDTTKHEIAGADGEPIKVAYANVAELAATLRSASAGKVDALAPPAPRLTVQDDDADDLL